MHTAPADPLIGRVLEGRYRIRTRLAVGGMSTVYEALDERLDRDIAVKVMASSLSADPVFVDRFSREARTAAKLAHVNAVSVYDQGEDAGNVFLVMELVRGRTLRDLIRERGRLSPAEAVSLMEPVLAALAAAHRAGLVHRDVKPENILLSDDGVVKVADFGLARAVESNSSSTRTGLMMGTVAYSSPEQFRGSAADIRSDVYSAGVVLFELLTGTPPYSGPDAMAVAYQHVHSDVPAPSSRQRGIAAPLDDLVRRATARDPDRRPADAGAFLGELHDVRRELRLPVMPVPRRRRPVRATTAAAPAPAGPRAPVRPAPAPRPAAAPPGTGRTAPDPRPGRDGVQHTMVDGGSASAAADPATAPPRTKAAKRRRRWLRTVVGALVLVLVCAAIIYGSWWYTAGRYASIPDVSDRSVSDATTILQGRGFNVITQPAVASETVASGNVVQTDPTSGSRLVQGKTVKIIPSSGPVFYPVPDVHGKTQAVATQALAALSAKGITVTASQASNDTVPVGAVVSTTPPAGTKVKKGDTVVLVVSTGPPIIALPDVHDQPQADATTALTKAGFKVGAVTQEYSDTVDSGKVISQDPAGPSQQRKGTTINLVVSKGPEYVTLPKISGKSGEKAKKELEDAGMVVVVNSVYGGALDITVGLSVDKADTNDSGQVRKGSTVTIDVA